MTYIVLTPQIIHTYVHDRVKVLGTCEIGGKKGTILLVEADDRYHIEHLMLESFMGSGDWDDCIVTEIIKRGYIRGEIK